MINQNHFLKHYSKLCAGKTVEEIREAVEAVFGRDSQVSKKVAIYICQKYSGRKLKEIGAGFGVGESAVSQTKRRFEASLGNDRDIQKKLVKLQKELELSNV